MALLLPPLLLCQLLLLLPLLLLPLLLLHLQQLLEAPRAMALPQCRPWRPPQGLQPPLHPLLQPHQPPRRVHHRLPQLPVQPQEQQQQQTPAGQQA